MERRTDLDVVVRVTRSNRRYRWPSSIIAAMLAGVFVMGCRSDSLSAPGAAACSGQPGCRATPSAPVDPIVYSALDDATLRLVPNIGGSETQETLSNAIASLAQALKDGRSSDARADLANVYTVLAPLGVAQPGGTAIDPPDVAALRLDLLPAVNALGVLAQ